MRLIKFSNQLTDHSERLWTKKTKFSTSFKITDLFCVPIYIENNIPLKRITFKILIIYIKNNKKSGRNLKKKKHKSSAHFSYVICIDFQQAWVLFKWKQKWTKFWSFCRWKKTYYITRLLEAREMSHKSDMLARYWKGMINPMRTFDL